MNVYQMIAQIKQNPRRFLGKCNIPQNVDINNPDSIIQYLMNSGRISQDFFNQKYNQANMIMRSLY